MGGEEEPPSDYLLTRVYDLGAFDYGDEESDQGYDYEAAYDLKAGLETTGSDEVARRRSRKLSEEISTSHDYVLSLADGSSGGASTTPTGWIGGELLRVTIASGSLIGVTGGLMERSFFSATLADIYPPEMTAHIISETDINAGR